MIQIFSTGFLLKLDHPANGGGGGGGGGVGFG